MFIQVVCPSLSFSLEYDDNDGVAELKTKISHRTCLEPESQALFYSGKELRHDFTLEAQSVLPGSTLICLSTSEFHVVVESLDGTQQIIPTALSETFGALKNKVNTTAPRESLRFIYAGQELHNLAQVSSQPTLHNGSIIYMLSSSSSPRQGPSDVANNDNVPPQFLNGQLLDDSFGGDASEFGWMPSVKKEEDMQDALTVRPNKINPFTTRRSRNDPDLDDRTLKRMAKNRASAERSRQRKQAYVGFLESKIAVAGEENTALCSRMQELQDKLTAVLHMSVAAHMFCGADCVHSFPVGSPLAPKTCLCAPNSSLSSSAVSAAAAMSYGGSFSSGMHTSVRS